MRLFIFLVIKPRALVGIYLPVHANIYICGYIIY